MLRMKITGFLLAGALAAAAFTGCDASGLLTSDNTLQGGDAFVNPGDYLGGNGEVETAPSESSSQNTQSALETVGEVDAGESTLPEDAAAVTAGMDITAAGRYSVTGTLEGKISVEAEGVTLYLENAELTNTKKVIESSYPLTITLIGENSVANTNADGSNAIDCAGALLINSTGSLTVTATKNAVKANSISVVGATLTVNAQKDGLHAEVDAYDAATEEPVPSYEDGGYVYLSGATLDITSTDDAIQADTFIYIGTSQVNVLAGGGAPETVTTASSDSASGKGIRAGALDWGADGTDLEWDGYLITVADSVVTVDANDDAVHSDGEIDIVSGTLTLTTGDDGVHADELLTVSGGTITVTKCYEGLEAAKVEIAGGTIDVTSYEDGINAADGSATTVGVGNANCHIIISGGSISVNCIGSEGDGIDSNGTILISGGEVFVAGSSNNADAALDSDGGILVNGGYLFAAGALGMVETPASNSAQCCVSYARNASISADTTLYLCDAEGDILMYFSSPRSCQSVIMSCPELTGGQSYSLYAGDSLLSTFTVSGTVTTVGSSSSISNPSGTPGGTAPGGGTPGFGGRR